MTNHLGTKKQLLVIIDEMEAIVKNILETYMTPKQQRLPSNDYKVLMDILLVKDNELKEKLKIAREQQKIELIMLELQDKVAVQDEKISTLQKSLTEAEQLLSTSIFQARLKLASIARANKRPVAVDELIKYAHRISATHAVSAPLTWNYADVRRPYPTDIEMRNGFLGKSDLNINGSAVPHPTNFQDAPRNTAEVPNQFQNQFNWNNLGELHMSMATAGGSVPLETRTHKEATQDDVEVMSTDSSSSSSSDSQ